MRKLEPHEHDAAGGAGSVVETAEEVGRRGGVGIPVRCDHASDADTRALFERIASEQGGRLDVLVNNALTLPDMGAGDDGKSKFQLPFWKQGPALWDAVCNVGLRSHYVASCFAAPIMIKNRSGLIVNVSSFGGLGYTFNVAYGVGKAGVDRLSADMARELESHDVGCVSLWPGIVKTDRILKFAEGSSMFDLSYAEDPLYAGRAVAALAADPSAVKKHTGKVCVVAELAREYGFRDADGSQPPSIRSLQFLIPNGLSQAGIRLPRWAASLIPPVHMPWWLMRRAKFPANTE
eukprot:jgi/Chlat1/8686/Chrsp88S08068